ncbi:outer membrane protein assembly factor BamA, partial [Candidatus Pelagibacter sp.]|nr:outer membrane protein assembly factor BamA [Candidatus Pelagibacter sp.]
KKLYMKLFIKKNLFKKIYIVCIFTILFIQSLSYAEIINEIKIKGNDRITNETIILFGGYNINDNIESSDLNNIIKNLYETSFFKDVSINFEDNILLITVDENPLIQSVVFEGIKNKSLIKGIKEIILQKEKSSFVESKVKKDQDLILNSLRVNGYYFSEISTKIKNNSNNTVDIIYNVSLGEKALIKNIKFIGNKIFKNNKLRKVIVSEEAKFWKFLSTKKTIDVRRFDLDQDLLNNFYKNNGYYNVKINSSYAKLIEDNYFEIVFNIDAGEKFYFNNLSINLPTDYNKNDFINISNLLESFKGKTYSLNRIEDILDEIDLIAINENYEFVSATYDEKIVDGNKINLSINLSDTEKYYIDRINITGNYITSERVIRNQLLADEGDPYNEILVNKSFNKIKSLGIFKSVKNDVETFDSEKIKVINIEIEEKPTGEIFAGAGTGTSGSSLSFGISENNYLGEGIELGSEISVSDQSLNGRLFINEPNYKNSNRSFLRSFQRVENDYLSKFGYKTEKTGFTFGTSYEQYKDIFFSPKISNFYEEISTTSKASKAKRKQDGDYLDLILDYRVTLNKLNQNFNPTDGYRVSFTQELPLYSEDFTLVNRLNYTKYFETENNVIYSLGIFTAASNSLSNDDARITKRIIIPSRKLRGFEPGKIGPKDGSDFIGGNYGTSLNFASTLPRLFTEVQDLDLSLFFDAANVWAVDYDSSIDDNSKIRSSTGVALDWFTPIGPLSLSYSFPITKSSTDVTENFRFNIGTTF